MLTFPAKTEEEVMNENLLAAGDYRFHVVESTFCHSKAGNPQIKLKLLHSDTNHHVYTQLTSKFLKLLKHFCDAARLEDKYQQGTLEAHDCLNKEVIARIGIQPHYTDQSKNVNYVEDFLKELVNLPKSNETIFTDDPIPF